MSIFAALETGGTKVICAVGTGPRDFVRQEIPTTTPKETLEKAIATLRLLARGRPIRAVGLGCFGPIDLNPSSQTYGFITSTPKPGWSDVNVVGPLRTAFESPIAFDTDVSAAMLAEARWGAAKGLKDAIYVTVGTGIGGGILVGGKLLHGAMHPEIGHMRVPHDLQKDEFLGSCPYHGDCLEGLASGLAIASRWGIKGQGLSSDHPAWGLEAEYLAFGLMNLTLTLSPGRIILGGGVIRAPSLLSLIRLALCKALNCYVKFPKTANDMESFVVPTKLEENAGVLGALALAMNLRG